MKINIFLLLLLQLFYHTAWTQTITWQPAQSVIPLIGEQVSLLEDAKHQWTVQQVAADSLATRFVACQQKILNTNLTGSHYWVRFTLDNPTDEPLILEAMQPLLDTILLSFQDTAGLWRTYQNGFSVPLYQKEIKHNYHLFRLPQGKTTLYVRLKDDGWPVPLSIWNEKVYEAKAIRQKLIYGIYMGIMLFVILTNIFWFFSLGWYSNLHYAFFVFGYAFFSSVYEGYIVYFFPSLDLDTCRAFDTSLNNINGIIYTLFFLEIKKYVPHLSRPALFFACYFSTFLIWRNTLPIVLCSALEQVHGLITILFICYVSFKAHQKGNPLGLYYGITYIIFFFIAALEVVYDRTGAPTYLFEMSYISMAILVEVFSLAFLLSKRLEWENTAKDQAKMQAQAQLLVQTKENERILANQNEILEEQVNERTAELQHSLGIIQQQSNKLTLLMKELHHRVKNNLQIVSSLLNLQTYRLKDDDAIKALQEGKHRVDAMSLIHQHLYQTDDISRLDIHAYTCNICESLMHAYGYSYENFNLTLEVPKLYFSIDTAIPIGLILNELVTNSFKYAYKNVPKPALTVILTTEGKHQLDVIDNGMTFKKVDWDGKSMSFGKQLITSLTQQVGGQLSLQTENGTHFRLTLPHTVF